MALSALTFSIMSCLVKEAGRSFQFTSSEIVFYRSVIQMILAIAACRYVGVSPFGPERFSKLLLVARGSLGAISLALYFFTLLNMPLGDGTAIFFAAPALTSLAAAIFIGEVFLPINGVCVVSCLIGVVLVAKPTFIGFQTDVENNYPLPLWIPSLAAFLGAITSSAAYVTIRMIAKNVHFFVNVFYFGLVSTILSSGMILFFEQDSLTNPWSVPSVIIQLSIGVLAFVAQSFLNQGLQLVPAGPGTLMRNLDIVFAFIFGIIFFNEHASWLSIVGSCLISGTTAIAAMINFYSK